MNAEHGVLTNRDTVRFERLLPGPIDLVWEYITDRDKLRTWLVDGFVESRVGADISLSQASDELPIRNDVLVRGIVTRCEPPRLLAYTWRLAPPDESPAEAEKFDALKQSEVIFELEERGESTLLVLTHRRIPTNHVPGAGASWHAHLEYLMAHMARRDAKSFFTNYERVLPIYVRAQRRMERRNRK